VVASIIVQGTERQITAPPRLPPEKPNQGSDHVNAGEGKMSYSEID